MIPTAFNLTRPCGNCPFRSDRTDILEDASPDWAEETLQILSDPYLSGHSCHKTDPTADGFNPDYKGPTEHCAGISILLKREGVCTGQVLMAISKAVEGADSKPVDSLLGWDNLEMDFPVYTRDQMIGRLVDILIKDHFPKRLTSILGAPSNE